MKMINHLVKNNAAVGQFVLQGWVIVIFYVLQEQTCFGTHV